jgi:glycosyltransferase involved in cell wall biosynthesis
VKEGIPLTILEAMAWSLSVVATHVGGNPEVVIPNETGILVQPCCPQALANARLALVRAPDRARRMGVDGRDRVEQAFDIQTVAASYKAFYLKCCAPSAVLK